MDSRNRVTILQNTDALICLYKIKGGIYGKQNDVRFCLTYTTKEYYPPITVLVID
jgi:hypothetical protein